MNPFRLTVLNADDPFCDREEELSKLTHYGASQTSVVLFSPRRYGKSSLARRVQARLARHGVLTMYANLLGVTSVEHLATKLARAVLSELHRNESLLDKGKRYLGLFPSLRPVFKPSRTGDGVSLSLEIASSAQGMDLLSEVMERLGEFLESDRRHVQIVLDEFQEVVRLQNAREVEGVLRGFIQNQRAEYFYLGSRRSVLLDMFIDPERAFYRSTVNMPLDSLPYEAAIDFLRERFASGKKECARHLAEEIVTVMRGHPYYIQAWPFHIFQSASAVVARGDLDEGLKSLMGSESMAYAGIVQLLPKTAVQVLKALAAEPTESLYNGAFMQRHRMTANTVRVGVKKLVSEDLVEKYQGQWRVVDPLFSLWLENLAL